MAEYDYATGTGYPRLNSNWQDYPTTSTPVTAAKLNHIDQAVKDLKALTFNVRDYQAVGNGSADDTAEILAAIEAARTAAGGNSLGSTVLFPFGEYVISGQITVPYNVRLQGMGRGEFLQAYGASTIRSTYNGVSVLVNEGRYGWGISDLNITGDRSLASQDLLCIGTGNAASPTLQGAIERVYVSQAGRDNIVIDDALGVHFHTVYSEKAKRHGLRVEGQSNGHLFTNFKSRTNDQWGVYWKGGLGSTFNTCVIEANSRDVTTSYGGMWIDPNDADVAAHISLTFIGVHFEQNAGLAASPIGKPLQVSSGTRDSTVTDIGSIYVETDAARQCSFAGGEYTGIGIWSNLTTHAVITGTTKPVVFINPHAGNASGLFAVTDTGKVTRVMASKEQYASVASAGTVTLPAGAEVVSITGTTTINTITASYPGRQVTLIFVDAVSVGDLVGNINIGAAFTSTANDTLSLVCDGTNWIETGRSVN